MGNNNEITSNDNLFIWLGHPKIAAILAGEPLWHGCDKSRIIWYRNSKKNKVAMPKCTESDLRMFAEAIDMDETIFAPQLKKSKSSDIDTVRTLGRLLKASALKKKSHTLLDLLFDMKRFDDIGTDEELYESVIIIILDCVNKHLFLGGNKLTVNFEDGIPKFSMSRLVPSDYTRKRDEIFLDLADSANACKEKLRCGENFQGKAKTQFRDVYQYFHIIPMELQKALSVTGTPWDSPGFFTDEMCLKLHTFLSSRYFYKGYYLMDKFSFAGLLDEVTGELKDTYKLKDVAQILDITDSNLIKMTGVDYGNSYPDIFQQYDMLEAFSRLCRDEFGAVYKNFKNIYKKINEHLKEENSTRFFKLRVLDSFHETVDYMVNYIGITPDFIEKNDIVRLKAYDLKRLCTDENYITDYEERFMILADIINYTDYKNNYLNKIAYYDEDSDDIHYFDDNELEILGIKTESVDLWHFSTFPFICTGDERCMDGVDTTTLWHLHNKALSSPKKIIFNETEEDLMISKILNSYSVELKRLLLTFPYAFFESCPKSDIELFIKDNPFLEQNVDVTDEKSFIKSFMDKYVDESCEEYNDVLSWKLYCDICRYQKHSRAWNDINLLLRKMEDNNADTLCDIIKQHEKLNERFRNAVDSTGIYKYDMLFDSFDVLKRNSEHIKEDIKEKLHFTSAQWKYYMYLHEGICYKTKMEQLELFIAPPEKNKEQEI